MDINKPITTPYWEMVLSNLLIFCAGAMMAQQFPRVVPSLATYGGIVLGPTLIWASRRRERQSH